MPKLHLAGSAITAAMLAVLSGNLAAQSAPGADSVVQFGARPSAPLLRFAEPSPVPMASFDTVDTLPCPQCMPRKRFWLAAAELLALQVIPNAFSRITKDAEWAKISFRSWGDNLTLPWQWDNNAFLNNQFSHPYHGSTYFNAARSNGYSFWQSAPWALVGSATWELFGEVWAPAPNDLLNTTLGGITLGEMLYRVSSLTLKNESSGFDRVVREVAAGLLDPVRGFNRVITGDAWKVSRTPPDWRPTSVFGSLDLGYRRFDATDNLRGSGALDQAYLSAELVYGNPVTDLHKSPFSYFSVQGALASNNGTGKLTELVVRGSLAAKPWGSDSSSRQAAVFMTYDYINNPVISFGAQGFAGGPMWNLRPAKGPYVQAEILGRAMPIAAVGSDYYLTAEGRDYDYGIGLGGDGAVLVYWHGVAMLKGAANYVFVPIISGFPGTHQILTASVDGRVYLKGRLGIGASYGYFWRWSYYIGRADVTRTANELRIYLSTAVPRWGT